MKKHALRLVGGSQAGLRVPLDVLVRVLEALREGAQRAVRLAVEGESVRKGQRPAWLEAATRMEVTGLSKGSTVIAIEAPALGQSAPRQFPDDRQVAMFSAPNTRIDPAFTAVDVFGAALAAALFGDADAIIADRALLDACWAFVDVAEGYDAIELGDIAGRDRPVVARRADIATVARLRNETPPSRAVRVSGRLETISASTSDVVLVTSSGDRLMARVEDVSARRELFGREVTVSATATFRPTGRVLHLDVEHVAEARPQDVLFADAPVGHLGRSPVASIVAQDMTSGVSALFGTWPGDEDDEALQAAAAAVG